jgi:cyclic 2,3-diphosphoglycerate synthetase
VLGYRRFRFASYALAAGAEYQGADFTFSPPSFHTLTVKPAISIIGTGKRIGKTAVSGYVARELSEVFRQKGKKDGIVVIAMGRGGPPDPEVIAGSESRIGAAELLAYSRQGKHAASDYFEDAALSEVTTVGCRRCGGGLAGAPFVSNVVEGAEVAETLPADLLIFEGSGAALPPSGSIGRSASRAPTSLATIIFSAIWARTGCYLRSRDPDHVRGATGQSRNGRGHRRGHQA